MYQQETLRSYIDVRLMPLGTSARLPHMSVCWTQWSSTLCQHLKLAVNACAEPPCRRYISNTLVSMPWCSLVSMLRLLTATGHSLTIVGFEKRRNGTSNLLVFDPMFKSSPGIQRLIGTNFTASGPERLLKAYRRCRSYLRRYKSFEMLRLSARAQPTDHESTD
jgi:hypothetical protein